jgi:hypothetical protein
MKKFLCLSVALLLALAVSAPAQTAVELIKAGDDARDQRDDAKALESYLAALELEPENYEALWKASGSMVDVADLVNVRAKGGLEKQKKYYQDAAEYARKAIAVNPNDTNGHFQLSAALGMYALGLGNKEKIAMSREIKAEIEKSIELDPNNDGAYHALGRWHRTIAEIGGAKRLLGGHPVRQDAQGNQRRSADVPEKGRRDQARRHPSSSGARPDLRRRGGLQGSGRGIPEVRGPARGVGQGRDVQTGSESGIKEDPE